MCITVKELVEALNCFEHAAIRNATESSNPQIIKTVTAISFGIRAVADKLLEQEEARRARQSEEDFFFEMLAAEAMDPNQ